MNNEVLYILLPDYAAREKVYISQAIAYYEFAMKEQPKYVNKVVAPTLEPVKSIGGFRTLPDYSFETMPDDYATLVLIAGFGWRLLENDTPERIEMYYQFNKKGSCALFPQDKRQWPVLLIL